MRKPRKRIPKVDAPPPVLDMAKVNAALAARGLAEPGPLKAPPAPRRVMPDMEKVAKVIEHHSLGAIARKCEARASADARPSIPEDASLRKQVKRLHKGCSGFFQPNFHTGKD